MADASNGALESDLMQTRKRLEVVDKNYRNLKGLSQKGEGSITWRIGWSTKHSPRKIFSAVKLFQEVDQNLEPFVSVLAVIEFEELQKKCQEYYEKASILLGNCLFLLG